MVRTRTNGAGSLEAQIDGALDDSFPASDPPAFTPVTHVGEAPRQADPGPHRRGAAVRLLIAAGAATMVAAGAILAIAATRRRRSRSRGLPGAARTAKGRLREAGQLARTTAERIAA